MNDDLISRRAAIEAVGDVHPMDYNGQAILHRLRELPTIDEYDVVEEYCRKRCLVIMTADLFEKIKREFGGAQWIR